MIIILSTSSRGSSCCKTELCRYSVTSSYHVTAARLPASRLSAASATRDVISVNVTMTTTMTSLQDGGRVRNSASFRSPPTSIAVSLPTCCKHSGTAQKSADVTQNVRRFEFAFSSLEFKKQLMTKLIFGGWADQATGNYSHQRKSTHSATKWAIL